VQADTVTAPSNVYFVLDRSASVGVSGSWSAVTDLVLYVATQLGPRATFGAAVYPGPSSDACATGLEVFSTQQGDGPVGSVGPTTSGLLKALDLRSGGGAPLAATLDALASKIVSLGSSTSVVLVTDGAPSCDSQLTCDAGGCIANLEDAPQCPTGGPPNCCDPTLAGPLECLDDAATLAAIGRVSASGVPAYVVATDPTLGSVLDQMARAGGGANGSVFGLVPADEEALVATLGASAGSILDSCSFALHAAPSDPSLVSVDLDGTLVEPGPDGWSLSGSTVTLAGAACDAVTSASVGRVRISVGCPPGTSQ
jgi:hypothetical protein